MSVIVFTDGGARGNPGPAAIGVVIRIPQENPIELCRYIGESTNNVAEYSAVIEALKSLKHHPSNLRQDQDRPLAIQFYLDSTLVVNQLNGRFKVKNADLRSLLTQVRILEQEVGGSITYTVVPRERNTRADFLVNKVLDAAVGKKY